MQPSAFTTLWGTGAHSSLTTPSQLERKGEGTPPQSAESGSVGGECVALEGSLGGWSLISSLAGQARELGLGSAGHWEPLLILEQRCDEVFESFRKLNQMVRGPDDMEEVEPKGRPPDSASQAGGTWLKCL